MPESSRDHINQASPSIAVRPLDSREVQPVAALLADVFADEAAHQQTSEPRDALAGLRWMFAKSLLLNQRSGTVKAVCAPEAPDQIIGTFSLIPPDAEEPSLVDYIKLSVLGMPFKFGVPATCGCTPGWVSRFWQEITWATDRRRSATGSGAGVREQCRISLLQGRPGFAKP
jgi:hypothetical protein